MYSVLLTSYLYACDIQDAVMRIIGQRPMAYERVATATGGYQSPQS